MSDPRRCERCGGELIRRPAEKAGKWARRKFCSVKCANSGRPMGPKTKYRRSGNRRVVGDVQAHRVIWEAAYGPIPPGYVVHHKNADKRDNRIENLELMTPGDHARHHLQKVPSEVGKTAG